MPTCSFFCDDRIIDANFYAKLQKAVYTLVETLEETEFLFTNSFQESPFLAAALEAKQRYPQKKHPPYAGAAHIGSGTAYADRFPQPALLRV